jgi:hypothetical protein
MAKKTGKLKTATKQTPDKQATTKKQIATKSATAKKPKFAPDAIVTWVGKENPFREKCGA